ncbi:hypothetical protein [Fluviicola taffensis]|uniref:Uncharacterized protein n=1 Tax=Fluviicola taffensis (strain DSM 16823 / NCIMB 13979 / RW262) TaxID=755732 RepID=F2IAL4_FLUTR|nr:hypothetical protein [Fluviicola taffensis]AEA43150.1 hypothetical protein Fluta_1155 [Fluviicola taffensis DSM 16823]
MDQITQTYQKASDITLISLARNPKTLRDDAQSALLVELTNRGMDEEVENMKEELEIAQLLKSDKGIDEFINKRIAQGYPTSEIGFELKERGINMFEIQNRKGNQEEVLYSRLVDLKNTSGKNKLTEEKLKSRYELTDEELAEIKRRAVRRGKTNLVVGITLTSISGITFLMTFFMEHPRFALLSGAALGVGLIIRGNQLRKV